LESSRSIQRDSGALPDAGFENEAANPKCACLRFERSHEPPSETLTTRVGRHVHPLQLGGVGIEKSQSTAADRSAISVRDEENPAGLRYFLGI